jgi:hypothetical protein
VVPPPVVVPEPVVAGGGAVGVTGAAKDAPVSLAGGETVGLVVTRSDDEASVGAGAAGRRRNRRVNMEPSHTANGETGIGHRTRPGARQRPGHQWVGRRSRRY